MKGKKVGVSSSKATTKGVKPVVMIRKKPEDLILPRLREYLVYSKLRSLLPPQPYHHQVGTPKDGCEGAIEVELEPQEMFKSGCFKEKDVSNDMKREEEQEQEEKDKKDDNISYAKGEERTNEFVPSVKIRRMDGSIFINTIVLKHVSLTSTLFRVFEEEKLDIVFENQYRTETKVAHTIHVKVQAGYDIDALEERLCTWAGKHM